MTRVCACGCGTSLEGARPQALYASSACRSKAWKARRGYRDPRKAAERAGKPSRSASPRRREGVTVYFPTYLDFARVGMHAEMGGLHESDPGLKAMQRAADRARKRTKV